MNLTQREKDLITTALYLLEIACVSTDLDYELADDLGGIPEQQEVRELMDKLEQ